MGNLVVIADKSEAYVHFERDRVLKDWGIDYSGTRAIQSISEAGVASLFGDAPVSILSLEDKELIKSTVEKIKEASASDIARWTSPGLIILTSVDRTSTKTLEKLVVDNGGEVILSKEAVKGKGSPTEKLVDELSITRDLKTFLKDYAGDNYSSILALVKTLSALSPKQQQGITIDDLLVRMPQAEGAIPPWEIEPAIMRGDVSKAITLYRRVSKTSHLLVVLAILKNKFKLVFKIASLIELEPKMNLAQLAETLGVPNNYPLKLAYESAKKIGPKAAVQLIELAAETEKKVKGGSSANPHVTMEAMITRIAVMVRR